MKKDKLSLKGWELWSFIKGRKKMVISIIGMLAVQASLNPDLTGLLAGGAVFEGVWAVLEYFCKAKDE